MQVTGRQEAEVTIPSRDENRAVFRVGYKVLKWDRRVIRIVEPNQPILVWSILGEILEGFLPCFLGMFWT